MRIVRTILVILSALLSAAHFLRAGVDVLAMLALGCPLLLLVREAWALRTLQILLLGAGVEWIRTLVSLAMARQAAGEPWMRMAVILGVVAVVAVVAALLLRVPASKPASAP